MGGTRNYDKVGNAGSGRKQCRHRLKRLAQPFAMESGGLQIITESVAMAMAMLSIRGAHKNN